MRRVRRYGLVEQGLGVARERLVHARPSSRRIPHHFRGVFRVVISEVCCRHRRKKERKKTDNPREGWEDGTPPPHRDFKEGTVWC